ncbi:MAG: hypothetical protein ACI8TP_001112 [Acidimicrobiales bacterium]|jgi:hypothetical protein
MDHSERLEDIRQRLVAMSDELEDLGLDVLRQAVDAGAEKRPPLERTIVTARRAIDKAARSLEA